MTLAEIWKNEGMEQGLQAYSNMTLIQLTQKFGELPEELQQEINQADLDALNRVMSNIFTITSLEEVKAYLLGEVS